MEEEGCNLQPLDLITHINGKAVKDMRSSLGRVDSSKIVKLNDSETSYTIVRKYNIPAMSELGGFHSLLLS
jgi:hypothetical protein